MTPLHAITLGIIQGITEFLPISSSGHLIFVPVLFGWGDQGVGFDVMVHLGTLLAVVLYFRDDLKPAPVPWWRRLFGKPRSLWYYIGISMIPALVVGFLFELFGVELRSATLVGCNLIFWGMVLLFADYVGRRYATRSTDDIKEKDAWIIGLAQAVALLPGTSRSGITMSAALFSGLQKTEAARFSFLMSIPIIAIAGGVNLLKLLLEGDPSLNIGMMALGLVSSAVSGFVAIWGLMKIVEKWSFLPFALYRIVVGLLILVYLV